MTDRVEIPLRMLAGNLEILLEHTLPCTGISLKYDPETLDGVLLMLHNVDQETADRLGFRTGKPLGDDLTQ